MGPNNLDRDALAYLALKHEIETLNETWGRIQAVLAVLAADRGVTLPGASGDPTGCAHEFIQAAE